MTRAEPKAKASGASEKCPVCGGSGREYEVVRRDVVLGELCQGCDGRGWRRDDSAAVTVQ